MAELLVPTQFSEFTRCGACDRVVTEHLPEPPTVQLFDGLERDYRRRRGVWSLCPPCLWEFESVVTDLDRLVPVRHRYDAERDARPTACGRCAAPLDGGAALLDVWGNDGCETWFTGLCGDCADTVQRRVDDVPATEPTGPEGIYWPPALAVPEADLVTVEVADGEALQATLRALVPGDTVRVAAYQHGRTGRGLGQYLEVTGRVTETRGPDGGSPSAPHVLVEPVEVAHEYVAGRTDPYERGHSTAPYRIDPGADVAGPSLPGLATAGDVPVVRPERGDPLAVTVLERVEADDRDG